MRRTALIVGLLTICGAVIAQEQDEKKIEFRFKDASLDAVIEYLSEVTPWMVVRTKSARSSTKITAFSNTEIPLSKVLDFLNTALKPGKMAAIKIQNVVAIVSEEEAKDKTHAIHVGIDPKGIEISDQVITQIMPLHNISVIEAKKELKDIIEKAGTVAVNRHANVIVISGRSQDVHRLARILTVIDAQVNDQLKVKVVTLKNADAVEMAKTLNEVFKKESQGTQTQGGLQGIMRWLGGRSRSSRSSRKSGGGVEPQSVASQIVRIIADARTNSILITANEENLELVEDLVHKLDSETAGAMRVKLYSLQNADAEEITKVLSDLFQSKQSSKNQSNQPWWMRRMGGGRGETQGAPRGHEVRAVAETRTNSVLVTTSFIINGTSSPGPVDLITAAGTLLASFPVDGSRLLPGSYWWRHPVDRSLRRIEVLPGVDAKLSFTVNGAQYCRLRFLAAASDGPDMWRRPLRVVVHDSSGALVWRGFAYRPRKTAIFKAVLLLRPGRYDLEASSQTGSTATGPLVVCDTEVRAEYTLR